MRACSSSDIYQSSQSWWHHECEALLDQAKHDACLIHANKSYGAYAKDVKAAKESRQAA
jgi:hypothetical protein